MATLLSLFSGIGGFDIGFTEEIVVHRDSVKEESFIKEKYDRYHEFVRLKSNGFKSVFQNDILEGAKKVCELNGISHNYHTTSVFDLLKARFEFPKADVVIGGFPCQDFSHCGKRMGFSSDTTHKGTKQEDYQSVDENRGTLYKCFVEVVRRVRPKVFVAENVYGLLTMKNDPIKQIVEDFSNEGYDVEHQLIDCSQFGVPQTRKRVIIMGIRKDRIHELDENWNVISKNRTTCFIGKYFKHLSEPVDTIDLSQKLYSKAKRLDAGQGQKEIDLRSFAPTMRAEHHGNIEFRRHENSDVNVNERHLPERRLTVREAGLIQTFPPDFVFTDTRSMVAYKYIGNAVPPLLGYLIADKVKEIIRKYF